MTEAWHAKVDAGIASDRERIKQLTRERDEAIAGARALAAELDEARGECRRLRANLDIANALIARASDGGKVQP